MKPYVFKTPRSPFWQVRIIRNGRIIEQHSTRTEDEDRAWKIGIILALGHEVAMEPHIPKIHLRRTLRQLYRLGTSEEWKFYSIEEYILDWLCSREVLVSGATTANQRAALNHFLTFLGDDRVQWPLDELKPMHIREYAYWLINQAGHDAPAANQRLAVLVNLFNRAVEDEVIARNPAQGIKALVRRSSLTDQRVPHQPFLYRHIREMIDRSLLPGRNPEMLMISLVTLDLGGRTGDMFGLTRGNFELKQSLVTYHIRKVTKLHPVIMFPPTVALLREYMEHHLVDESASAPLAPSFYVPNSDEIDDDTFRKRSGNAGAHYGSFLVAAKIRPPEPPRVVNGIAQYDISFHSFRPTVSTALKLEGVPLPAVMARMPHKSEEISKVYNRFSVFNICQRVFEGVGLKVPRQVKTQSSLRMGQIFELMEIARQKLIKLRGKLDLYDGPLKQGQKIARARLEQAK